MSRDMKYSGNPWIGNIPCSWDVARIKTIFKERTELSEDGSETLLSVSEYYGVANRSERVSEGEFVSRAETLVGYKKCYVGDLVSNIMLAWKGSMGITEIDGIVSPAYCVYEPSPRIYPRYYHYLFRTSLYTSIFRLYSKGIIDSRLRLYSPYFFDISAIIPSLSEQQKIASFLDRKCSEIDEMIALQEKIVEELKAYKQSVITETVTKGLNPDVPMKDSGIEWIGEIPEHWEAHPFKAFYKTTKGLNITKDNLVESGIPVISYGQIHSKQNAGTSVSEELIRYVSADYIDSNPECLSKKYDIFFADTSEDREGAGNIALIDVETPIFAGYHTIMAHPSDRVKSKYIAYLIKTDAWRCQLRCKVQGVKLFSISQKFVNQTSIIVPPMSEQIQISEYLDTKCTEIDNLISIKLSKIDSLKEYKKSIIYEYVTGKKEVIE